MLRSALRSLQRVGSQFAHYLSFGTGHLWLDRILGVITLAISIVLTLLIFGEIGREIGFWIPSWDRQEVGKPLPGWSIAIFYVEILFVVGIRSYFFFRPLNRVKGR